MKLVVLELVRTDCVMLTGQLPTTAQQNEEMNKAGAKFVVKVKILLERGLPLVKVYRDFGKIAMVEQPTLAVSIRRRVGDLKSKSRARCLESPTGLQEVSDERQQTKERDGRDLNAISGN